MQDDLFDFIKSHTPAEKRFFKLNAKSFGTGNHNYVRLFEAIEKQRAYNEIELKETFKGEAFVRQFSAAKNTLMKKLKDSLRNYYSGSSIKSTEMLLRENLDDLEIFFKKKTYSPMEKLLKRSKKLAAHHEEYVYLYLFLIKEQFYLVSHKAKNIENKIEELESQKEDVLSKIELENQFQRLRKKVFVQLKLQPNMEESKRSKVWEDAIQHPLMQNEANLKTTLAHRFYHSILGYYHLHSKRYKKAHFHFGQVIDYWNKKPHIKNDKINEYLTAVSNYMAGCFMIGAQKEFITQFEIFKQAELKSGPIDIEVKKNICYQEVLYYLTTKKITEGVLQVPKLIKTLEQVKLDIHPSRLIVIYNNLAVLYFLGGKLNNSIQMLQQIINQPKLEVKPQIVRFAKLFLGFLYYESEMESLLATQYRSAYRSITNPTHFENCLLKYLKRLESLEVKTREERKLFFIEFKEQLLQVKKSGQRPTGFDEVYLLVESHITGKSVLELYKKAF